MNFFQFRFVSLYTLFISLLYANCPWRNLFSVFSALTNQVHLIQINPSWVNKSIHLDSEVWNQLPLFWRTLQHYHIFFSIFIFIAQRKTHPRKVTHKLQQSINKQINILEVLFNYQLPHSKIIPTLLHYPAYIIYYVPPLLSSSMLPHWTFTSFCFIFLVGNVFAHSRDSSL